MKFEYRNIFICTDLAGSDPDDYQSFIHMLFYLPEFNLTGVSCGYPKGKRQGAIDCIAAYEKDLPLLRKNSGGLNFPDAKKLRGLCYQGSTTQFRRTPNVPKGSIALIQAAREWGTPERRMIVLCWGSATDVALALQIEPSIQNNIFLFLSGDWNKAQDVSAHNYCLGFSNIPIVECLSSHRGIYLQAINDTSRYGNIGFVQKVIKGSGRLGALFVKHSKKININPGGLKMGDTPSFLWALTCPNGAETRENPNPNLDSWGGKFSRTQNFRWEDTAYQDQKIGTYRGARTVAKHRVEALQDWEKRILWLKK